MNKVCAFCKSANFGNFKAPHIDEFAEAIVSLAGGLYRYPREEQFNFCPECGAALKDPVLLTLAEMREMNGKPVWVVSCACKGEWAIVKSLPLGRECARTNDNRKHLFAHFQVTWLAYKWPPKEE